MAININNLHVRLHVNESDSGTPNGTDDNACSNSFLDKEEVVQETVKEVIRILKEQEER